jgi:hypothetical protein
MAHRYNTLAVGIINITRLQETLSVALSLRVRDPYRLLRIIRLGLISPLHVHGGQEEFSWIRIGLTGLGELDMARHGGDNSIRDDQ